MGRDHLFDLVFVALVRTGSIVGEGFRACEFVVGGGGRDYVAVAGYLAGEAGDGTGYWEFGSTEGLEVVMRGGDLGRFR